MDPSTKTGHGAMLVSKPVLISPVGKPPLSPITTDNKPSFISDWLVSFNMDHFDFARKLRTTPLHRSSKSHAKVRIPGEESGEQESSYPSSTKSMDRERESSKPSFSGSFRKIKSSSAISFKQKSIMIGNGWNAKGLEEARNGDWRRALSCWENAMVIRQQVLGNSHPDVANTWNNIGIALGKLDRVPEAMRAMETALELRVQHHGTEKHTEVAATYHNMANLHHQAGNYDSALKLLNKSLVLSQSLLGKKDIQVARTRMAIGHTHYDAGEYHLALTAYREALQIMELCNCGSEEEGGARNGLPCSLEIQRCKEDIQETEKLVMVNNYGPEQAVQLD